MRPIEFIEFVGFVVFILKSPTSEVRCQLGLRFLVLGLSFRVLSLLIFEFIEFVGFLTNQLFDYSTIQLFLEYLCELCERFHRVCWVYRGCRVYRVIMVFD